MKRRIKKTIGESGRAALLSACLGFAPAVFAVPEANTIEFSNCALSTPGTPNTAPARCGHLDVPENPDAPDGRKITLHVAVAEASDPQPEPEPLFFFAGGPGQAASETWPMIRGALRSVNKTRDIVLVDQRGTGGSNKLQCPTEEITDLTAEFDLDDVARQAQECLDALDGDADLRFYTTTIAAHDVDAVRRAMGYGAINIMGVSYGTRAAQVYLREFPDTVRTMTLDSVVPMQLALGQEHAPALDRAVDAVLADCAADDACSGLFPDGREALDTLFRALREAPRKITVTHPVTGEEEAMTVTAETLAMAIRMLSYSSETQAALPLLLHEAAHEGRIERLAGQAIMVASNLSDIIARGMELSVMCSEDYPAMDFDADYGDTILGNMMLQAIEAQCEIWPRGEVPADFHEPFTSDTPVLLMSGERDPVTPPRYAAQAAEAWPNSLNLVAGGQSHSVLGNVCLQKVTAGFIAAGSVEDLDSECVADIDGAPFFTTLLGPEP